MTDTAKRRATKAQVQYLVDLGVLLSVANSMTVEQASAEITAKVYKRRMEQLASRKSIEPVPDDAIDPLYCTLPPHDVELLAVSRKNRVVAMLFTIANILSKDRSGRPVELHEAALWAVTIALDHANKR